MSQVNDYLINAAQEVAQNPNHTPLSMTPDNKLSEGIDSVGEFHPAPFLPIVRFSPRIGTEVVISSQRPVAHCTDTTTGYQYIVPAGLGLDMDTKEIKYTKADVRAGIKNAQGVPVTEGEAVVDGFFKDGEQTVFVSAFCGIANYDILRHQGGDGWNAATLRYRNYNPQHFISYNMDYAYEYAMVQDQATLDKAPLEGISAFVGEKAMAGQFITYDNKSNFVLASEADFTYGSVDPVHIVGQVAKVTIIRDKQTGEVIRPFEQLNRVQTFADQDMNSGSGLNNVASSATDGLPEKIYYANGFGAIQFAIQTR